MAIVLEKPGIFKRFLISIGIIDKPKQDKEVDNNQLTEDEIIEYIDAIEEMQNIQVESSKKRIEEVTKNV